MFHVERATTGGKTEAMEEEVFHVEQNRPAFASNFAECFT